MEGSLTGGLCSAVGLVLRELCCGLVSEQQRETQNAAARGSCGQPGPELLLSRESVPRDPLAAATRSTVTAGTRQHTRSSGIFCLLDVTSPRV